MLARSYFDEPRPGARPMTTLDVSALLARLDELYEKATKDEWRADIGSVELGDTGEFDSYWQIRAARRMNQVLAIFCASEVENDANLALAVELKNQWPELSAALRAGSASGESGVRRELAHLVRLLEPLEADGSLNVPGLATLNGARAALEWAASPASGESGDALEHWAAQPCEHANEIPCDKLPNPTPPMLCLPCETRRLVKRIRSLKRTQEAKEEAR